MPSRLAFGRSTNASARLLALLRVMLRLCSISTWAVGRPGAAEAGRPFFPTKDCSGDDRDGGGACGGARPWLPSLALALQCSVSVAKFALGRRDRLFCEPA